MRQKMLRKNSIANKFFLGFFLTSTLAVLAIMLSIYFSIKNQIVEDKIRHLEVLHNIKSEQINETFAHLQTPFMQFLKSNYMFYGYNELEVTYKNLSKDFTDEEVALFSNELLQFNTAKFRNEPVLDYMHINVGDSIPLSQNGILSQSITLPYVQGKTDINGIEYNRNSIKEYIKAYKRTYKSLEPFMSTEVFQSI